MPREWNSKSTCPHHLYLSTNKDSCCIMIHHSRAPKRGPICPTDNFPEIYSSVFTARGKPQYLVRRSRFRPIIGLPRCAKRDLLLSERVPVFSSPNCEPALHRLARECLEHSTSLAWRVGLLRLALSTELCGNKLRGPTSRRAGRCRCRASLTPLSTNPTQPTCLPACRLTA